MSIIFPPPHHGNDDFNWDLDVDYNFDASVDLCIDTDVSYSSDICVDTNIDVCVDIHGNSASWSADVQAVGDDGAVESNVVAVVTDDYASLTMTGYAAVG